MRDVTFNNLTEEQINAIKVLLGETIGETCDIEKKNIFPKYGDTYYFINGDEICESLWEDDDIDKARLSLGNCFKTRDEAEFEVERLKVLHEMKKFVKPEDHEWDGHNIHIHFNIYYDTFSNVVKISESCFCKSNDIYFKSKEDAVTCIEAVGEDRIKKYYLEVDETDREDNNV